MTNILIVGLGLIGGSFAKALSGFPNATVYGLDIDDNVIAQAEADGAIAKGVCEADAILPKWISSFCALHQKLQWTLLIRRRFKKAPLSRTCVALRE